MTKLILLRHGQSIGNHLHKFLGHTDLDLSETGYEQAKLTAEYLANVNIDAIYSSDLIRAYNTAKPTADIKGIKIQTSANLREIYSGKWEAMLFDDIQITYDADYTVWRTDIGNAVCTEGESVVQLAERIYRELKKIAEENDEKTVLIATHATPIRCMCAKFANKNITEMKDIPWVKNASLTYVSYENGTFKLDSVDNTKHLKGEVTSLAANV